MTPVPPADATASQVLAAYVTALVADDCAGASQVTTRTFVRGNGQLCGAVGVTGHTTPRQPSTSSADSMVFDNYLTVSGGDDSLPDGQQYWCWVLTRQADGSWRLSAGGRACVP